jgi:hypothetical protein
MPVGTPKHLPLSVYLILVFNVISTRVGLPRGVMATLIDCLSRAKTQPL